MNMTDNDFDLFLREAEPGLTMPNGFRSEVWSRIALAEAASVKSRWQAILSQLLASFVRPLPATATIAATILLGGWLGSSSVPQPEDAKLGYAETISPFLHTPRP